MKIKLISISRQEENFVKEGCSYYFNKLKHYCTFEEKLIKAPKENSRQLQLTTEAVLIQKEISGVDMVVLLDENGKQFSSIQLSEFISKKQSTSVKQIVFVIGGAYGFDESLHQSVKTKISLSLLTLPHQLAKLLFTEQLYRAFTILRNEKYHHE